MGTSILPVLWDPALSLPPALIQHVSLSLSLPVSATTLLYAIPTSLTRLSLFSLTIQSLLLFPHLLSLSHPLPPRWLFSKHLFEAVK